MKIPQSLGPLSVFRPIWLIHAFTLFWFVHLVLSTAFGVSLPVGALWCIVVAQGVYSLWFIRRHR